MRNAISQNVPPVTETTAPENCDSNHQCQCKTDLSQPLMFYCWFLTFYTTSGVSRVWQVGPCAPLKGVGVGGGVALPLNRFVFDICYLTELWFCEIKKKLA